MASSNYILSDLIEDVVASMRDTGEITAFTETASGVYLITSVNSLSNNEVVNIDSVDYVVSNVTPDDFQIVGDSGLDFASKNWTALAPYFEHGHLREVANTLTEKKDNIYAFQKYPLIVLIEDTEDNFEPLDDAIMYECNANLAIVNSTEVSYKANDRKEFNFKPILLPIYDEFLEALKSSTYFSAMYGGIKHRRVLRYYWGSHLTSNSNIFNDPIDAIELSNANLKILQGIKTC